jgi:hypothetical protein
VVRFLRHKTHRLSWLTKPQWSLDISKSTRIASMSA